MEAERENDALSPPAEARGRVRLANGSQPPQWVSVADQMSADGMWKQWDYLRSKETLPSNSVNKKAATSQDLGGFCKAG
jgi:hypothetical protein